MKRYSYLFLAFYFIFPAIFSQTMKQEKVKRAIPSNKAPDIIDPKKNLSNRIDSSVAKEGIAPSNDFCGNAISLNAGISLSATNIGAGVDLDPVPNSVHHKYGHGVWFSFETPSSKGQLAVKILAGTLQFGAVSIYSGACGSLVELGVDNPGLKKGHPLLLSKLERLLPSTTYYIMVWDDGGIPGTFEISAKWINLTSKELLESELDSTSIFFKSKSKFFSDDNSSGAFFSRSGAPPKVCAPPNDNFAGATTIPMGTTLVGEATTASSLQSGESVACNAHELYTPNQSVWYNFTASGSTAFIKITPTAGCYNTFGASVWEPRASYQTTASPYCGMITCQGMDNNSATSGDPILIELCNLTAGKIYPIQMVQSTAGCGGASETFNIYVGTANPGGTITNPCPAPGQGSNYLTSPIPECYINACLTSPSCPGCTTYNYNGGLAIDENNIVGNSYYTFTTATGCSNDLQFQQCILSTCHTGNVDWFSFELYDATGTNCIASGDLVSGLTLPGVGCTTKYVIQYTYEMINCNYTDYTPFTDNYGSSTCVLPIELLQFNARENETEGVEVNWVTGTEVNNNYFTVDKSTDGINFSSLGKVTSVHNSEAPTAYTFTDTEPNAQSTVYYRLSQTDMNGDVNKFNIISLSLSHNYSISIYPNPSNGVFSFDFSAQLGSVVMTELTDASGIVLNTQIYAGSGGLQKHTFEVANPGVYMMTVKINGQILHYKLVKI